jgi:WD40 repeat protein
MDKRWFTIVGAGLAIITAGCQEPANIRMRFAAMVPGPPEQIVGVDAKHQVLLCDARSQEVVRLLGSPQSPVRELRVSSSGAHVATASADGRCRIWEVASGRPLLTITIPGAGKDRGAVAIAPGERLLACGGTGGVEVRRLPDGALVRRVPDPQDTMTYKSGPFEELEKVFDDARILSLDMRPTGHCVLLGTDQGVFEIDYLRCNLVWHQRGGPNKVVTLVRYAPNGSDFLVGDDSGALDYYSGHQRTMSLRPGGSGRPGTGPFTAAEFTRDGAYILLAHSDGAVHFVRLADQKIIASVSPGKLDPCGIAIAPDRRCAWVGSQGNVERFTRLGLPEEMWLKPADIE